MNYPSILSLLVCLAYVLYTGVIPSISDSYRGNKVAYHLFFGVLSVLVWAQSYYVDDALDFLYGGAGFTLFGISLWASFWKREEHNGHIIFTLVSICLGLFGSVMQLWPTYGYNSLYLLLVFAIGSLLIKIFVRKNVTYWIEILAILSIFIPILSN